MCGIAGVLSLAGERAEPALVTAMLGRLRHRGPDDEGQVSLGPLSMGMRRRSILDPTPRGHQPVQSADGRYWIVHNGEIYNFLELADELEARGHIFTTATDTEVILAAYEAWGLDCLKRFNGIWAFALWDAIERRLLLSRDRFGVKPLFVAGSGDRFAFASEIKALRALPWVSDEPDPGAIRDFLLDGMVDHSDATFFRAIRRVPAATSVMVTRSVGRQTRYWGPPVLTEDASFRPDPQDARRIEEYRNLLVDSVALQLRSDVPLGSCLSGGLDSSSIVGIASGLRAGGIATARSKRRDRDAVPQLAFFAEFREPGIDERPFVDTVVRETGVSLLTTTPDTDSFVAAIGDVMVAQDEPFPSTSIVAQYFVMKLAHESGIKVLLDGQGADETVGGYPPYVAMRIAGALRCSDLPSMRASARLLLSRRVPLLPTLGHLMLNGHLLPEAVRRNRMPISWLGPETRAAATLYPDVEMPAGTVLARNLWRQIASTNLPGLLRFEDRNSMAFGIEARVPFLDHRLVEAALLPPDRLKVRPSEQKVALRMAMGGIVPDEVLARRDKVAFGSPQRQWVAGLLASGVHPDSMREGEERGYLRPGIVARALTAGDAAAVPDNLVWRLVALECWLGDRGRIGGGTAAG